MKINIPTVQLSEAEVSGSTLNLPWIADYILGVYKYAVFAGSILAAVMIMIAGMQWMTAAGNASRVGAAKKRISNAVVGMVLLAGSFLLLETINPQLTLLQPISIEVIDREEFQYVSQEAYAQVTGGPPPPQEELEAMVRAVAEERGIDPCALETIVGKESGWRPDAIGHDENVPRQGVRSRRIFIDSGRRYDGSTFTERSYTERSIRNNDGFDPTNPPDYGMDGRFTHGIGLGQFTILLRGNEMTRCSGGEFGRTFGDRCYTAAELINPQIQMEAAANLYTALASRSCGSATGIEKHRCVFYHYAGSGCSAKVSECRKTKAWAQCAGEAHSERSSCTSWLQESNCSWQAR
jgi:hypothetical protein